MKHYEIDDKNLTVIATDDNGESWDLNAEGEKCTTRDELGDFVIELEKQGAFDEDERNSLLSDIPEWTESQIASLTEEQCDVGGLAAELYNAPSAEVDGDLDVWISRPTPQGGDDGRFLAPEEVVRLILWINR